MPCLLVTHTHARTQLQYDLPHRHLPLTTMCGIVAFVTVSLYTLKTNEIVCRSTDVAAQPQLLD